MKCIVLTMAQYRTNKYDTILAAVDNYLGLGSIILLHNRFPYPITFFINFIVDYYVLSVTQNNNTTLKFYL